MSSKWTYEIGYEYASILRDGVMVNKEQAARALNNYESRIAELEKDNDEFRQLIHDWIIILTPDDGYVPDSECNDVATPIDVALRKRIAKLEEQVWNLNLENERLEEAYWIDETISPDGTLKPSVRKLLERLEKAETDLRLSDDLVKALDNRIAELEAENTALKQHPQPIEFWSDEKKELYRRNESRTIKSGREEERER